MTTNDCLPTGLELKINSGETHMTENQLRLTKSEAEFAEAIRAGEYFAHQGQASKLPKIDEQSIFNRLPKNYFVHEEEPDDALHAESQILNMRDLAMANEILDPAKFLERHFGTDPELLFKEVITELPPTGGVTEDVHDQLVTGEILLKDSRNLGALD